MTDLNLVLLGPPGAGKGTQAARVREDLGLTYIATGDLLRSHRARGTELGRRAATYMSEGQLVSDELVVEMILGEIAACGGPGCLLDGFPQTLAQADALADALDADGRAITAVLLIDVPDELLTARITGRRLCPAGHVYHVEFHPPAEAGVCDHDGQSLQQRDDDQVETVRQRLAVYHEATRPLVDYYAECGLLRRVDGTFGPTRCTPQSKPRSTSASSAPDRPSSPSHERAAWARTLAAALNDEERSEMRSKRYRFGAKSDSASDHYAAEQTELPWTRGSVRRADRRHGRW